MLNLMVDHRLQIFLNVYYNKKAYQMTGRLVMPFQCMVRWKLSIVAPFTEEFTGWLWSYCLKDFINSFWNKIVTCHICFFQI